MASERSFGSAARTPDADNLAGTAESCSRADVGFRQGAVSAAIWSWQAERGPRRPVWPRAARQGILMFCAAALMYWRLDRRTPSIVVTGLAVFLVVSAWLYPTVFLGFERFVKKLGEVIGRVVTWLLLTPFFYLCFLPGRALLAIRRKDPLRLRWPTDAATYWQDCRQRDASHAKRQF